MRRSSERRTAYWALVTRMDLMIGEILAALQENDLAENTIILYMSDHGEQVGEHGLWWKQTFYEDSVRVPTILSWPRVLPEGVKCDRVISSLDLNATMLDALDAPALPHSRGRSVLPLLQQSGAAWEDIAFSEYCTDEGLLSSNAPKWRLETELLPWAAALATLQPKGGSGGAARPGGEMQRVQEVLETLTQQVLDGWDAEDIAAKMKAKRDGGKDSSGVVGAPNAASRAVPMEFAAGDGLPRLVSFVQRFINKPIHR